MAGADFKSDTSGPAVIVTNICRHSRKSASASVSTARCPLRELMTDECGIYLRPLSFIKRELREAALVVDRDSRTILYGALGVVDADVLAKNCSSVHGWIVDGLDLDLDLHGC